MKVTGWMCPNGEFVECDSMQHLAAVRSHPVFFRCVPEIERILDDLAETEEMCQDLADREGASNAEWHIYERKNDRAGSSIVRLMLDAGFIRVGSVAGDIHFEGRPNRLKSNYQLCKDFADSYGAKAVFEPQKRTSRE